jgi:hypothetical protein
MKRLNLSIPKPCSENWNSFPPTASGGFCSSCSKTVIDFTTASDEEIISFIKHKPAHACGRFRANQIKSYQDYNTAVKVNPGLALLKAATLSILLSLVSKPASAQSTSSQPTIELRAESQEQNSNTTSDEAHLVVGVVKSSEDGEPLPGVNVLLKGSTHGTATDGIGRFEFPVELKTGDVLVFSFIGYTTKEYPVSGKVLRAEISLQMCLDTDIMGELAINEVYDGESDHDRSLWQKLKNLF